MKPDFALSLSHDDIALLHKSATEWRMVGKADPASPRLGDELAAVIAAAGTLGPQGVFCKLIIPNDQIKFLKIAKPQVDPSQHMKVAAQALEGTTPYRVDELAYDVCQSGECLSIAAVARETLAEAETFAVEHGFKPVSFVAQPDPDDFDGEPFFGKTEFSERFPTMADKIAPNEPKGDATEIVQDRAQPELLTQRRVPTFRTASSDGIDTRGPGFEEPRAPLETKPATAPDIPRERPKPTDRGSKPQLAKPGIVRDVNAENNGHRGILLAVSAVCVLGLVAFLSNAMGINLFERITAPPPSAQFTAPLQPQVPGKIVARDNDADGVEQVSLESALSDEDVAVLDALSTPQLNVPAPRSDRTEDELRAAYAVTGIWPLAPDVPAPPPQNDLEDFYQTSIDPIEDNFDAIALPALVTLGHDVAFPAPAAPAPAGTRFNLDERGMVIPTDDGALNPDGVLVYAGAPPVRQPEKMQRIEAPGEDLATRMRLADTRPKARPENLIESNERAALSGLTRAELGQFRPKSKPASAQETALAAASASLVPQDGGSTGALIQPQASDFVAPTARAVVVSLRPDQRPGNFEAVVSRAQTSVAAINASTTVTETRVTPRINAPQIPSSASVSREATVKNAINLRQVNLIGVYGKPSSRRALVRLENGRFQKVQVGDRIDGGRVSAISDSELRYQKSGRSIVLKMPKG